MENSKIFKNFIIYLILTCKNHSRDQIEALSNTTDGNSYFNSGWTPIELPGPDEKGEEQRRREHFEDFVSGEQMGGSGEKRNGRGKIREQGQTNRGG